MPATPDICAKHLISITPLILPRKEGKVNKKFIANIFAPKDKKLR